MGSYHCEYVFLPDQLAQPCHSDNLTQHKKKTFKTNPADAARFLNTSRHTQPMEIEGSATCDKHTHAIFKPIETQNGETLFWVRRGEAIWVRPHLKYECMTDWEIALNYFPAIRIDPPGGHQDNIISLRLLLASIVLTQQRNTEDDY